MHVLRSSRSSRRAMLVTALVTTLTWLALAVLSPPAHALKPLGGTPLKGKFKALVVWVQDYEHWSKLTAPKKDAERIAKALTDKYLFAREDVELLGNPTQADLFKAVKSMATKARSGDSILIVFAGHGYLEAASGQGYWVPRDAKRPGDAAELSYLSSAWVRDVLKGSEALHVAVVSDSCFSGALLSSRGSETSALTGDAYYSKMYQRRSFEGLTSGALETVDDTGAPGGHSPFAYYFALALESPDNQVFDLQDVFQRIRQGVKTLSRQTPLFGRLAGAPSDGGAFVFVAKDGVAASVVAASPSPGGGGGASVASRSDEPPSDPAATSPPSPPAGPSAAVVAAFEAARTAIIADRDEEALRIALKARFCEAGHFEGCALLADAYTSGYGTVVDKARGLELYATANALAAPACDRDDENACYVLGESLAIGRAIAADPVRAGKLLRKACDLGQGTACGLLGTHMTDKRIAGSPADAAKLWEKGCKTGDPESCHNAGVAWDEGRGVKPDAKKAATHYGEGCDGGHRPACGRYAVMVLEGRGVDKNLDHAAALGTHACEAGDHIGCMALGAVLVVGTPNIASDHARALTLFQDACNAEQIGDACHAAGELLYAGGGDGSRPEDARPWLEKGCVKDSAGACTLLGRLFDDGIGGDMDFVRAKELYEKGCKLGDGDACKALE